MSLFANDKAGILLEPKWLQPLSDPPDGKPLCCDGYLRLMARYLADIFTSGQARNLFIYGPPGTGKTACVMYVLNEVAKRAAEVNAKVKTAYVNAGKTRNPYYTMAEIVKQLGIDVPGAGWQMFRLKQAFEGVLAEKSLLIAIDEVDSILFKEKEPLVYYLSRQPRTTLILISNDMDDVVKLQQRALSTLQPVLIGTTPYTSEEIKQILKQRIERAYKPNAITDKMLNMIAKTAAEVGDIRFSFQVLLTAALLAEKNHRETISAEDIASALEKENRIRKLKEIEALRDKLLKRLKKYERN
jgi:cell division control protein 6